jgi:hypothetical protein
MELRQFCVISLLCVCLRYTRIADTAAINLFMELMKYGLSLFFSVQDL